MSHVSFTATQIIAAHPKQISAIHSYANKLLLADYACCLHLYTISEPAGNEETVEVKLVRTVKSFTKRQVDQMVAIKETSTLIILSDSVVSLYDLNTLELQQRLDKTRGSSGFVMSTSVSHRTGIPVLVTQVAVMMKRKILLFWWNDTEFAEMREYNTPDRTRNAFFLSDDTLVLGFGNDWAVLDLGTMASSASTRSGTSVSLDRGGQIETIPIQHLGGMSSGLAYLGTKAPRPLMTHLTNARPEELLLVRDVQSSFLQHVQKGPDLQAVEESTGTKSLQSWCLRQDRKAIPWSTAPDQVGYTYPFLISLHKNRIEVRLPPAPSQPDSRQNYSRTEDLKATNLMQVIDINTIGSGKNEALTMISDGKNLCVASQYKVYHLSLVPFTTQIESLLKPSSDEHARAQAGRVKNHAKFEEALQLLTILDPVLLEKKEAQIRSVKFRIALRDFQDGQIAKGLDGFETVGLRPSFVVRLFGFTTNSCTLDLEAVEGQSESEQSTDPEEDNDADPHANNEKASVRSKTWSRRSVDTLRSHAHATSIDDTANLVQSSTFNESERISSTLALGTLHYQDSLRSLSTYLAGVRRKLNRFIAEPPPPSSPMAFRPLDENEDVALGSEEMEHEAEIVDTALLKVYIEISPGLVGSLVRVSNRCDPHVVQAYLEKEDRWKELIDFFYQKNLHGSALSLLEEKEEVGLTIQYLQKLDVRYWDVIKKHAKWALQNDPDEAMDIFLEGSRESESFDRRDVLVYLESIGCRNLAIKWLEFLVDLGDFTPEFSNRLIELYVDSIQANYVIEAGIETLVSTQTSTQETILGKLLAFLDDNDAYSPTRIISYLPSNPPATLIEVKAILLGKIGQLGRALGIYVYKLQAPEKAESYAAKLYLKHANIFETLLSIYLQPHNGQEPLLKEALALISVHGPRLEAEKVLELLPSETQISQLEAFFEGHMREFTTQLNTSRIGSTLREIALLRAQLELIKTRNKHYVVGPERVCAICYKRLGLSVLAVFPDGGLVHYGCQRNYVTEKAENWLIG